MLLVAGFVAFPAGAVLGYGTVVPVLFEAFLAGGQTVWVVSSVGLAASVAPVAGVLTQLGFVACVRAISRTVAR